MLTALYIAKELLQTFFRGKYFALLGFPSRAIVLHIHLYTYSYKWIQRSGKLPNEQPWSMKSEIFSWPRGQRWPLWRSEQLRLFPSRELCISCKLPELCPVSAEWWSEQPWSHGFHHGTANLHHHNHITAARVQNHQCRLRAEDLLPGQAPGSEASLPAFSLESASDFYRSKTKQNPS